MVAGGDHGLDLGRGAVEQGFDGAVQAVADPASKAERAGGLDGPAAIPDPLDASGDAGVEGLAVVGHGMAPLLWG